MIIRREGFRQPAASRKRKSPVQVWPGELGNQEGTDTEVGGRIRVASLIAVTDTQGEPGPELARVETDGAAQRGLGTVGLAKGKQGRSQEIVVTGGMKCGLLGPAPISCCRIRVPQRGQQPRTVLIERGRH